MIQRGRDGQYDELTLPDHTVIVEAYLYAVLREIIQRVWSFLIYQFWYLLVEIMIYHGLRKVLVPCFLV